METRTVLVKNVSDLAREREIREFSPPLVKSNMLTSKGSDESGIRRVAFVTFKDPAALEIALRLSGATIVDQIVDISLAKNFIYIPLVSQQVVVHAESEIGQETSSG